MKITAIHTFKYWVDWCNWLFVRIDTDEGLCGWGEGSLHGAIDAVEAHIRELAPQLIGQDPAGPERHWHRLYHAWRWRGGAVSQTALSALDIALWDLKARLLHQPLSALFGRCRADVPIYGSGGFTTYDDATTTAQLELWVGEWEIPRVKIKIGESWGTNPERDLARVKLTRSVVGDAVEIYVDANGGYTRKQAVRMGRRFGDEYGVVWFEEPVSSDDLVGLREVRDHLDLDVAAGEYGYDETYFATMVAAEAVDCLQVDVTRCGGYTSWLRAAAIAGSRGLQVSAHCAPNLHAHVATAVPNLRHVEYFHDHHRIETMLFDGALDPRGGALIAGDHPGHGLALRMDAAEEYRVR